MGTLIDKLCPSNGFVNVCLTNARSIYNKVHEYNLIISKSNLHAILITETWLHPSISSQLVKIDDFYMLRNDRLSRTGGGVAIYLRNGIKSRVVYTSKQSLIEFLVIEISNSVNKCALCVVYSPPSCFRQDNLSELESCLLNISQVYSNIVVGGDFNVNLLLTDSHSDNLLHFFQRFNLSVVNTQPTYHNTANPSQLDLFLVTDLTSSLNFGQIPHPSFLDHDILVINYAFPLRFCTQSKLIEFRDFANINYPDLFSKCENIDWSEFYNSDCVDNKVELFNEKINYIFDECVPLKTIRYNPRHYPWFTVQVQTLISEREFLFCKYKRLKNPVLREEYKKVRNKVNSLIKKLKYSYYRSKLDPLLPAKTIWSNLRSLGVHGKAVQNCNLNPDLLNQHFLSTCASSFDDTLNIPHRPINENCNNFSFACSGVEEVATTIYSIKSSAVGPDGIHPRFIKIILPFILSVLCHLFNSCLTYSKFPALWKVACVLPVPKKADSSTPSDYRPISILCFLSKVLEKIMFSQITSFIDKKNLLTPWQSGFRSSHSCETALIKVTSDIRQFVDVGEFVILTLLDFSKAFDSVSHPLLLFKLVNNFDFSSSAISLVSDFLNNRRQMVKINACSSHLRKVTKGVPQGSILGPLFFSLFINDLPSLCKFCFIHLYADDVQLYLNSKYANASSLLDMMNHDLAVISKWASENDLILNPSKSQCLLIGNQNKLCIDPVLILNNEQLEIVEKVKNLGVIMNSGITCCDHIKAQLSKIYGGLRSLRLTSGSLTQEMRLKLVRTLLIPHFLYGCVVYPVLDASCARKIEVAFNDCLRYIYGLPRYAHISSYRNVILGCSLENYFSFRCLILFFKILYTSRPAYLRDFIKIFISKRLNLMRLPTFNKLIGERSYFVHTSRLWNGLPREVQRADSVSGFRGMLWSHISQLTNN